MFRRKLSASIRIDQVILGDQHFLKSFVVGKILSFQKLPLAAGNVAQQI
jgi:hypothetical protein